MIVKCSFAMELIKAYNAIWTELYISPELNFVRWRKSEVWQ